MKTSTDLNRRQFIKTTGLSLAAVAATSLQLPLFGQAARPPFAGLKFGVASYSFRKFTFDQAIAMTAELGLKYICLKDVHLDMKSTPAQLLAARRKVEAAGLTLIGGGVMYITNNDEEIRNVFEYAKGSGMPTIVCSPEPAAIDTMEKMAIKYNIRVAIHNHGPGDKKYPLPSDAFRLVQGRDERLGLCIDVGHTTRVGGDPIAAIKECAGRLYDFHLKDVSAAIPQATNVVIGKGIINIPAVLKALLDAKFTGHLGMEYEATPDNPLPGMKESVAYVRKVLDQIG